MFDTAKVQQMLVVLERFAREREEIYVIPEWLNGNAFALFRRMGVAIRAVLLNAPQTFPQKEIFGCPIMLLNDAARHFTPKTGIILLSAKPQPNFLNAATFTLGNQRLNVPIFAATSDEVLALYDRLTLIKVLQQYGEDGIYFQPKDLATRFARGLTTFLDPRFQNFKYQLWDSREYFKPRYDFDDTAIVIQGPITYENNYTAETFKLYRSIYPNVPIVVSTWQGEATDAFRRECENNSVVLLENEMPDPPGAWHINCQLKSSFCGVKYVQENTSATFVLKTRADQRIIQGDFLLYFKNMILTFPPFGNKLQGRILTFDYCKWSPFHICDLISFGYLSDILKLYSADYSVGSDILDYCKKRERHFWRVFGRINRYASHHKLDENLSSDNIRLKKFNSVMSRWVSPEIYIMKTFHEKYIAPIDKTKLLETALKFIHDYILIVGNRPGVLDWPKYEFQRYNSGDYYTIDELNVSFSRWLDMYRHFNVDWV